MERGVAGAVHHLRIASPRRSLGDRPDSERGDDGRGGHAPSRRARRAARRPDRAAREALPITRLENAQHPAWEVERVVDAPRAPIAIPRSPTPPFDETWNADRP